ncbi:hypothetical protein LMG19282_01510 [Cupriavidus campinensis]|nr:hypothetical protein LMG19282_01510 [Cupriavidus campinensis]
MPLAVKATVNGLGKLMGTSDVVDQFQDSYDKALDKSAEFAQEWTKKRLESHKAEKESVVGFRRTLEDFTTEGDTPTVIFIDELDRCRPAFAVSMIERIKHFFEVPNLVFVLVMNRSQLEKAICGVYGAETDAAAYLGKFLHLSLRLPKQRTGDMSPGAPISAFVRSTLARYNIANSDNFAGCLAAMAVLANLSLRDIERACALYVLAGLGWNGLMACLITIRIKHQELYEALRDEAETGRATFGNLTTEWYKFAQRQRGGLERFAQVLFAYGQYVAGTQTPELKQQVNDSRSMLFGDDWTVTPSELESFQRGIRALDLDVAI